MSRILKIALILIVMLAGLAFHLRNDHAVDLDFYLGVVNLPLSLYVIGALCLGAILGVLTALPRLMQLRRQNHRLQKHLRISEKELNNLRVIPIRDDH